jgi:serine/threonine protein kinase
VRELDPRIPPGVERIVDKALAKNPSKRYQRASEVAEDIRLADIL